MTLAITPAEIGLGKKKIAVTGDFDVAGRMDIIAALARIAHA